MGGVRPGSGPRLWRVTVVPCTGTIVGLHTKLKHVVRTGSKQVNRDKGRLKNVDTCLHEQHSPMHMSTVLTSTRH
jgi:hypothetical protein